VKLLFDQNLAPTLVTRLADLFPDSLHVETAGLDRASDDLVWDYARQNGFAIVSKDEDYSDLSVLRGNPPKVLWSQIGNCTTKQVEAVFRARFDDIKAFENDPSVGTLALN
jgi:predicted nuclease of predicted toxin-antitoxin system